MTGNSDEQTPGSDRPKLDATGEFFSVGAPLHAVRAGYVRRPADNVLYETVMAGRFAHVIAPDRSGKSSLIAATAARLEANGFKVAILDLEQIGIRDAGSDPGRWYYSVAYRLLRQLRIRVDLQTWWQDKSILSNRQRLLEFYTEIVLQNVPERVVVFVDEIQTIGTQPFGDQLLASIRAAHNARATDPEFSRLTFVLLGECDPLSLIGELELSPFNITQPVTLGDFSREDLDLFLTELNLTPDDARAALDRIYYWTSGQPYLSQKLARAISRDPLQGDVAGNVDRIVAQQFTGRAALHNEPHLSHIHRELVNDKKLGEPLLNLFGRIRKGVFVETDLGSPTQRRLIAVGLIDIDAEGQLKLRNRIYETVFTARWANENLPTHWRAPLIAAAVLLVVVAIPFWYTQLLPRSYVEALTSDTIELASAEQAYTNFRSFPGHVDSADSLFESFLRNRARQAIEPLQVNAIAALAETLPEAGRLPEELVADFWDRRVRLATRAENRDEALLASLESLTMSTSLRRSRAASFVGDDYPLLIGSAPAGEGGRIAFNPDSMLLTETRGAQVGQWSLGAQGPQRREDWTITALEVPPLVRRVIVDREGDVRRIGLTINLSHPRVADLRIKVISPSGRTVEVVPNVERASSNEDLRIPASQLRDLLGEPLAGTWSLSVRDEELGAAGILVGWNLTLNSQGLVEDFQRGLNIPDPVEQETDDLWFSNDGRFAVARALLSDSARIWDLGFAKPVRAVAVSEAEQIIGLSANARLLLTATQDTVNLWDTTTGNRAATLAVGAASASSELTPDGTRLFVQRRGDINTEFEIWSLTDAAVEADLEIAGSPALVALDAEGRRIAIADFDRAVRVWDFQSGELIAQIDLAAQPSEISLTAGGDVLGVVSGEDGAAVWRIDRPQMPILNETSRGRWQLRFSPTGTQVVVGRPGFGYQVYATSDGRWIGPTLGGGYEGAGLLGFSADEQVLVTGAPNGIARFWRAPTQPPQDEIRTQLARHTIWPPSGHAVAIATPDAGAVIVGDRQGDVHIVPTTGGTGTPTVEEIEVSYFGHSSAVRLLTICRSGELAASVAEDNTIRIWDVATGIPRSFFANISGNAAEKIAFAADGSLLAILSSNRLQILDTGSGQFVARFELGERHRAMAFADDGQLYVGSDSGVLRVAARDDNGGWGIRELWQGDVSIRWLAASPEARHLVLVDQNNLARQFNLAEGAPGPTSLQLPSSVQDLTFSPSGSRILFRTTRWVHVANSSADGLAWADALPAPKALSSAKIVFGEPDDNGAATGQRFYVPVAGNDFMRLAKLEFSTPSDPGLFGTREELLEEWRRKLGLTSAYE